MHNSLITISIIVVALGTSGCWAAAAGAGAEAGYVAAQEERSAGETIDDQVIVTQVKTRLLADNEVSGMNINVDSFRGVVTLKGFVESGLEADKAISIARGVSGVREVRSRLVVD